MNGERRIGKEAATAFINPLETELLHNFIYRSSPYLTGNTSPLHYKAQPVNAVWGNSRCLLWEEHTDTLCGQNVEFWCANVGGTYSNHWALKGSKVKLSDTLQGSNQSYS
jgi:hypothetical protein